MRTALFAILAATIVAQQIRGDARAMGQDVAAPEAAIADAMRNGAYTRAERTAEDWVDRLDRNQATGIEVVTALDALNAARVKTGKAGLSATLADAQRAVSVAESVLAPDHTGIAAPLHVLGAVQAQRGDFAAALSSTQRALQIRSRALSADDPLIADSLDQTAFVLVQRERFADAWPLLGRSLVIREAHADQAPLALASTLDLIGMYHRYAGTFASAVAPLDRALSLRVDPNHPDRVGTMVWRADVTFLMGDVRGAQAMWRATLDLAERTLDVDHPVVAEILRRLGLASYALGNLADARELRERALEIGERRLAVCDPSSVTLMNAVASSRQLDGEYSAARALFERARLRTESCAGSNAALATILFNEADLSGIIGNLAEAEQQYRRAVAIWSKSLGPNHPFVARGLSALADVSAQRGRTANARSLYEQALTIQRRSLGASHPQVAWTLTNLAQTIAAADAVLASRYVDQAVDIYRTSGVSDEPDHFVRLLELRSELKLRRGAVEEAHQDLVEALSIREQMLGTAHPLTADTQAKLARVDLARGESGAAVREALASDAVSREHLRTTIRYLPEREAMAYAARRPAGLDVALSLLSADASERAQVLDAIIRSRGVILEELAERSRSAYASTSLLASDVERVTAARQRFATLMVRSFTESVPLPLLEDARRSRDAAERDLAERSADVRSEIARRAIGVTDVRLALPGQSVLVSFIRYNRLQAAGASATSRAPRGIPSYGVFVTGGDGTATTFIPLGPAATLDVLVKAWHDQAAGVSIARGLTDTDAERLYAAAAMRLRQAIWDPLVPHLTAARRVFIVPDGQLTLVNFAALPDGHGYLAEAPILIHYLTTERDLTLPPREADESRLLAVGDPAFDGPRAIARSRPALTRDGCSLGQVRFERLPGSLNEVSEISRMWQSGGNAATVLSGAGATESAVKQAAAGRRVVHFATHGFFLGAGCPQGPGGTRAVGGLATASSPPPRPAEDNPLSLSGLVLAGANLRRRSSPNDDDGILTAEEIAGLNLQGLEWAVLSACDTGLGDIRAGEGVIGLRRAFQVAGARTVIMSLWEVDDRSTEAWMKALYRSRFQRGLSTVESVHAATIQLLSERRSEQRSTHPFFWAPFVAAGDWR